MQRACERSPVIRAIYNFVVSILVDNEQTRPAMDVNEIRKLVKRYEESYCSGSRTSSGQEIAEWSAMNRHLEHPDGLLYMPSPLDNNVNVFVMSWWIRQHDGVYITTGANFARGQPASELVLYFIGDGMVKLRVVEHAGSVTIKKDRLRGISFTRDTLEEWAVILLPIARETDGAGK
jgi:hypothetical protein